MYGLLPRPGPPALPLQPSVSDQVRVDPDLDVDLMQPDLLLSPCRVRADVQDLLHLTVPDEQDVSGDEESDALRAGGAGQGAYREYPKKERRNGISFCYRKPRRGMQNLEGSRTGSELTLISPELAEPIDLPQNRRRAHARCRIPLDLPETEIIRQGRKERRVRVTRIDPECQDGPGYTLRGRVDEMELGFRSVPPDGMISGRVDVPSGQVDGLVRPIIIECETREGGVDPLFVGEGHGRSVTPVEERPICRSIIPLPKPWDMVQRKPLREQ